MFKNILCHIYINTRTIKPVANQGWGTFSHQITTFPILPVVHFVVCHTHICSQILKCPTVYFLLQYLPAPLDKNSRQDLRLSSKRHIRYEASWLILYELCFFYIHERFFLNIVCGKTEIMNSNIKSNVSRVPGGTPNICACVTGFFGFLR